MLTKGKAVQEFIAEDELTTFEGWLKFQCIDAATITPDELEKWRCSFNESRLLSSATPKVGLMKLRPVPGEHRYAVAVREGTDLWLTLWVRHSRKGEFFVMLPRGDQAWDVHASYHLDGTRHIKSHGHTGLPAQKIQPLTGAFRGTENLVTFAGYGPKTVGAICDPSAFSGIVEIAPGILGPRDGQITVDLLEPGCQPPAASPYTTIVRRDVFRDTTPWVVITSESFS